MARGWEQARAVTRLPLEVGKRAVRASLWGGQQVAGRITLRMLSMGRGLTLGGEHIAERLEATQPLSEARMGAEYVRRGLREDDAELTAIGGRQVAQAVVSAGRDPAVPDGVTGEVVYIGRRLPVDPLKSSLVRPELAEEARGVIEKFDPVQYPGN